MLWPSVRFLLIAALITGCASSPGRGGAEAEMLSGQRGKVTRAELQDLLLRFEGNFSEDLRDAAKDLESSSDPKIRNRILNNLLLYDSSSLSIALGPVPESNLLDMVVFVVLCRETFEDYWIPNVYGQKGLPILGALRGKQAEIEHVASLVLTPDQVQLLEGLIERWRQAHPGQFAVEGVRLTEIAEETGAQKSSTRAQAGGLLAAVERATIATDEAVLLGERSLYYAQRLPALIRMQARVGLSELMSSLSSVSADVPASMPVLASMDSLLKNGTIAAKETHQLLDLIFRNEGERRMELRKELLAGFANIIGKYNQTLDKPVFAQTMSMLPGTTSRFEAAADRILVHASIALMVVIGFTVALLFSARVAYVRWAEARGGPGRTRRQDRRAA
jgi:hypothetical protein